MLAVNNSSQLLKTPSPQADESLMGYILRLTEENAYLSPSWIFDLAGLKVDAKKGGWAVLYREGFDSLSLRKITGLTLSEFEGLRYHLMNYGKTARFLTNQMPVNSVRLNSPKICPACLKEANYHRMVWDLLPFTVCPAHRLILIDKYPECDKTISWVRKKVSVCRCNFDWRYFTPSEEECHELACSQLILKLCGLSSDESLSLERKNNPLYDLELSELCLALHLIADYYSMKEGHRITATTENKLCHEAYSYAFSTFEGWPENFNKFLIWFEQWNNELWSAYENQCRLYKRCSERALSFIIIAFEDFLEDRQTNESDKLSSLTSFRRFISVGEACQRFGIAQHRLNDLILQASWRSYKEEALIKTFQLMPQVLLTCTHG
jgi:hypothetical protein